MSEIKSTSEIKLIIGLDEQKIPVSIKWQSENNPEGPTPKECKAMLVSLFDKETLDTLKIDLWTKEMQVMEMDRFMFQTLRGLADTYMKATNNAQLAGAMQQFVQFFGEETEVLPKEGEQ